MQLIVGGTRMGKTFGVVERLKKEKRKIVVCDPQNSLASEILKHTVTSGKKIIYDNIERYDKTMPIIQLKRPSKDLAGFAKMEFIENQLDPLKETLYGPRDLDPVDNPTIEDGVDLALRCIMHQEQPVPLYWAHWAIKPKTKGFEQLRKGCNDEDVREEMWGMNSLHLATWKKEYGPAHKLLKTFFNRTGPASRCGNIGLASYLDQYDILICSGGKAKKENIDFVLQSWIIQTCNYVNQKEVPIVLVVDEAANYKLMPRILVQAIATQEKHGLDPIIITQSMNFEEEVVRTLEDNASRIEVFGVGSNDTASNFAELFGARTFDFDKKDINTRKGQRHDGYTEDGKAKYIDDYQDQSSRVSGSEQTKEWKKKILNLQVRERIVGDYKGTRKEKTPDLKEGFPWPGVLDNYVISFLPENEKQLEKPIYKEPTGVKETGRSKKGRKSTSAQQNTSSTFSRAGRKRTKGSKNSEKRKDSDT